MYQTVLRNLTGTGRPEAVSVGLVAPEFFTVLQARPSMGRTFFVGEDQPGHGDVVVVSDGFWKSHLGSNAGVLGQTLTLDRRVYNIVGVMPSSFEAKSWGATSMQMWIPRVMDDAERALRGVHNYNVVARLKSGVDLKRAQAEIDTISSQLERQYPNENAGWGATVIPLHELLVGNVRTALLVLLGAVAFVLLIASANVANLVLGRALGRRKEIAIRTALGASRGEVVRQILTETALLSLAGGALGLILARLVTSLTAAFLERQLPLSSGVAIDGGVLAFTLTISVLTGVIAGLAPALRASKADLNDTLKQGLGRTDTQAGGRHTRGLLVVSEVALSLMLLIGAGLMIRSLWALRHVDPGLDPHNVVTMSVVIPQAKFKTPAQQSEFFDETLRRVRALPSVDSAGVIDNLPMSGGSMQPIVFEGRAAGSLAEQPEVAVRRCSPGYFRSMRIPLRRGRDFTDADTNVVLVSESMAQRYWRNEDPIGRRIRFTFIPNTSWEVIGVVGDVKQSGLSVVEPVATAYQWTRIRTFWSALSLVVRTSTDPSGSIQAITGAIHDVDSDQPVRNILTMDEILATSLSSDRFTMLLLAAFAVIALLLAGVGICSVLSYAVRRRTREIGIRTALGAGVFDVLRLVVIEGMKPALAGVALGIVGALSLERVLKTLLFGVSASDPFTFVAVSALIVVSALVASLMPAYRAARVDPLKALREE
jgi:predicted permease